MAFNRQPHPGHCRHLPTAPGDHDTDLLGPDRPARGLNTSDFAALDINAGDFAILDQVNAPLIRPARIAPGHCVMPRCARAPLHQPAIDRKARVFEIEIRHQFAHLFRA